MSSVETPMIGNSPPSFWTYISQEVSEATGKAHQGVQWMQHTFTNSILPLMTRIDRIAHEGLQKTQEGVQWLEHAVTHYCDKYLPHPINVIAKAALGALPFIILQTCLPTPLYLASVVTIIAYSIITRKPEQPSSLRENLLNAFTFRNLFLAGTSAVAFAQTGAIPSLLWSITNLTLGVLSSLQSGLAQNIFNFKMPTEMS